MLFFNSRAISDQATTHYPDPFVQTLSLAQISQNWHKTKNKTTQPTSAKITKAIKSSFKDAHIKQFDLVPFEEKCQALSS